jgi:Na+/H+ antiporter NhaA
MNWLSAETFAVVRTPGAGWLTRIGFTMSLFMAGLGFSNEAQLVAATVGVC